MSWKKIATTGIGLGSSLIHASGVAVGGAAQQGSAEGAWLGVAISFVLFWMALVTDAAESATPEQGGEIGL